MKGNLKEKHQSNRFSFRGCVLSVRHTWSLSVELLKIYLTFQPWDPSYGQHTFISVDSFWFQFFLIKLKYFGGWGDGGADATPAKSSVSEWRRMSSKHIFDESRIPTALKPQREQSSWWDECRRMRDVKDVERKTVKIFIVDRYMSGLQFKLLQCAHSKRQIVHCFIVEACL